jgi:uncharacterized membrane protein YfcA
VTGIDVALLAVAGFAAGVVNAVAGGGTFFTFGALVETGLPTLTANTTSALALTPANIASVAAYRKELALYPREALVFSVIGAGGSLLGALLLIWLGDAGFRPFVPWLLLFATLLFAFNSHIATMAQSLIGKRDDGAGGGLGLPAYLFISLSSVYGGFFGAGIGIIMLAALGIIETGNFHKINAIKNLVAMVNQAVAVALFVGGGLISWPEAFVTMAASVVGGYLGVSVARRVPVPIIRAVVVTIGAALTVIFFLRG